MIITWIFCLIFVAVSTFFIFKKIRINKKEKVYDICTHGLKDYNIIGFVFYVIGCALYILSIYFLNDKFSFWTSFSMGMFFLIITLIIFIDNNLNFEAVKGQKFIVCRFFKSKEIDISYIKAIQVNNLHIIFYQNGLRKICSVDAKTRLILEIVDYMKKNYNVKVIKNNEFESLSISEDEAKEDINYYKYIHLGGLYRKNYNKYKKAYYLDYLYLSISYPLIFLALGIIIKNLISFILIIFYILIILIIYINTNKKLKKELDQSDYNLGVRHCLEIKEVKGSSKYFLNRKIINVIGVLLFGIILLFPIFFIGNEPINEFDLVKVEGTLDYIVEKDDYIAIGLNETNIEYRLGSIEMDYLNDDLFEEISENMNVILFVEDKIIDVNNKYVPREFKSNFHYLKVNEKEYFTYDDYLLSFNENKNIGLSVVYVGAYDITVSIVYFIILVIKYRRNKKKEYIELN